MDFKATRRRKAAIYLSYGSEVLLNKQENTENLF